MFKKPCILALLVFLSQVGSGFGQEAGAKEKPDAPPGKDAPKDFFVAPPPSILFKNAEPIDLASALHLPMNPAGLPM